MHGNRNNCLILATHLQIDITFYFYNWCDRMHNAICLVRLIALIDRAGDIVRVHSGWTGHASSSRHGIEMEPFKLSHVNGIKQKKNIIFSCLRPYPNYIHSLCLCTLCDYWKNACFIVAGRISIHFADTDSNTTVTQQLCYAPQFQHFVKAK